MIDKLQTFVDQRCSQTKELLKTSGHTERAAMKNFKLLCQEVIEKTSNMLSKEIATSILLENLRDIGWTNSNEEAKGFESI